MKKIFYILCLIIYSLQWGSAQICDGNFGENIFTEGDFGSGVANILLPDPQIAPGYIYQSNPPPNDGYYSITNNTTNWGSFATNNWSNIQDNSNDPNGYMMIVNCDFNPGLFYQQAIDGLCENTLYVFSVDVYNLSGGIRPNVSFLLNGVDQFDTGDVPQNEAWNNYGFTFTTLPGQTNLTLALRNNAPGGIGNDIALDNISFRACGPLAQILPQTVENICEDGNPINLEATIDGDQYPEPAIQWQQSFDEGLTWENIPGATDLSYPFTNLTGGVYYYRYLLANGMVNISNPFCRVNSNVKIVNVIPKFYSIIDTLCTGLSFTLNNRDYAQTGIYIDSLTTYLGCDSIVTLDLTIVPDTEIELMHESTNPSCDYLIDGSIVIDTILNGVGPFTIEINEEINANGDIYGLPNGDYNYTIMDRYGCSLDSTITLETPFPFEIDLGEDLQVELGEIIEINPAYSLPAYNFIWQTEEIINCELDCENLTWSPSQSTNLTLTANSLETDCIASDEIYIQVLEVRKVYIPNAFSPNFDGINDRFTIFASEPNVQGIEQLIIYDRWGQKVFEQQNFPPNDISAGWDGTYKRKDIAEGVYVFFAEIRFIDDKVILYEGDITLMR